MLEVTLKLTPTEAEILKYTMGRATDQGDFRGQWKSQNMKNLEAKVISAVALAEQEST